jgi:hypothetical protein
MAFQMSFTDEYDVTYPESYWKVTQTNMCQSGEYGYVEFQGFQDAANKGKRIIGTKNYSVTKGDYIEFFGWDALNPDGKNPVRAAYEYAVSIKDVGTVEDAVSFFEDAIEV